MTQSATDTEIKKKEIDNKFIIPEIISMLNAGHTVTLGLRGVSMRPFLEDRRDKAILRKPQSIHVGDAVLAEVAPKRYVLHRIIAIEGNKVTLRGDGNLANETCSISDVHGYAEAFYRKGRKKADSTSGRKWLLYSYIWTRLYPIRRYLLFAYRIYLRLVGTNNKSGK